MNRSERKLFRKLRLELRPLVRQEGKGRVETLQNMDLPEQEALRAKTRQYFDMNEPEYMKRSTIHSNEVMRDTWKGTFPVTETYITERYHLAKIRRNGAMSLLRDIDQAMKIGHDLKPNLAQDDLENTKPDLESVTTQPSHDLTTPSAPEQEHGRDV